MSPPTSPRKRPHPASGARRIAGWLSIAAMFGLTGGMAVASRIAPTSNNSTSASTQSTAATGTATSSDDDAAASRAAITNALAGNASSQSVTVSRAS